MIPIVWRYAVTFALGLFLAATAQSWRYEAQIAEAEALRVAEATRQAAQVRDKEIADQTARELDRAATAQKLRDQQNEIEVLSARVADGSRRLSIRANCPGPRPVPHPAADARGADGGTAELDPAARTAYFQLRRGIAQVEGMLALCRMELKRRSRP